MRYLAVNEIWEWCAERRIPLEAEDSRPAPDAGLTQHVKRVFAPHGATGREPTVAREAIAELAPWDECLLWVVLTGVWPSSEDWPAYYQVRGERGERRSLEDAPGHLYQLADLPLLVRDLAQLMGFGWEAYVLACRGTEPPERRLFVSHDGWLAIDTARSLAS